MFKRQFHIWLCIFMLLCLTACGAANDSSAGGAAEEVVSEQGGDDSSGDASVKSQSKDQSSKQNPTSGQNNASTAKAATKRDNTPKVRTPKTGGDKQISNDVVSIDVTHKNDGYIAVKYDGDADKIKTFVIPENEAKYQYDIHEPDGWVVLPLPEGDGTYDLEVYEHIADTKYATLMKESITVKLKDEFAPFLYPNQFCWFTQDCKTVAKGAELAEGAESDLDVVGRIYDYIINDIEYDDAKAELVTSGQLKGYIPEVDEILESHIGICLDYAVVMCTMLRSQRIPTKLEIGYSGEAYHAWLSIWTTETGWVEGVLQFDGKNWTLADPTLGANNRASSVKKYIGDGSNYTVEFSR